MSNTVRCTTAGCPHIEDVGTLPGCGMDHLWHCPDCNEQIRTRERDVLVGPSKGKEKASEDKDESAKGKGKGKSSNNGNESADNDDRSSEA
jgi:hypothetical protein